MFLALCIASLATAYVPYVFWLSVNIIVLFSPSAYVCLMLLLLCGNRAVGDASSQWVNTSSLQL